MVSMSERGYASSGLASWSSLMADQEESNPDLRWPDYIPIVDRMRKEDAQVLSTLLAVELPVRRANWALDATGCRPEVVNVCSEDLNLPVKGRPPAPSTTRRRNRFSWSEHLELAQLENVFGHSVFEQVYELRDGLIRLRKLAFRPHRTIAEWGVARDGGLDWIKQHGVSGPEVKLDVDRLVVYVRGREGGNWAGQSMLRAGYKNWLLKDRILRSQALTIDRNGLGVPTYTGAPVPDGAQGDDVNSWVQSERDNGLTLAKSARSGETAGASIPHGAEFEFKGVSGELPDTDKPVRYHDEQLARAVLAHFLNLGTETGSWALGSTFADFFASSLQASALHLADITQQHVIDDLVDLNWGEGEPAPRIVFDEIGASSAATSESIKQLVEAGVLTPDDDLEDHIRQTRGLPVRDTTTARIPVTEPKEGE